MRAFARWRSRHAQLPLTLIEGNHHRHAGAPPVATGIDVVDEPWIAQGIAFCHHPQRLADTAVIAGHLHHCVRLYGAANDTLRLPCFWQRPGLLIVPAFGEFTGGALIARESGDRVIAVADGNFLGKTLGLRSPASLSAVSLLDRPYRRLVDEIPLRYVGFTAPDELFAGYGLGLDERWRAFADLHLVSSIGLPRAATEAA